MSQHDIEEVLITIASSPSPDIRGHGQPIDSPSMISCFYCGERNHISKSCPRKPANATSPAMSSATRSTTPSNADVNTYVS